MDDGTFTSVLSLGCDRPQLPCRRSKGSSTDNQGTFSPLLYPPTSIAPRIQNPSGFCSKHPKSHFVRDVYTALSILQHRYPSLSHELQDYPRENVRRPRPQQLQPSPIPLMPISPTPTYQAASQRHSKVAKYQMQTTSFPHLQVFPLQASPLQTIGSSGT